MLRRSVPLAKGVGMEMPCLLNPSTQPVSSYSRKQRGGAMLGGYFFPNI